MKSFIRQEPAVFAGLVLAVVQAVLAVLVAFAVPVTVEQGAAILGLTSAVLAVVLSLFTRSRVQPVQGR